MQRAKACSKMSHHTQALSSARGSQRSGTRGQYTWYQAASKLAHLLKVHTLPPEWCMYLIIVTGADLNARDSLLKSPSPAPESRSMMLLVLMTDGPGSYMTHLVT